MGPDWLLVSTKSSLERALCIEWDSQPIQVSVVEKVKIESDVLSTLLQIKNQLAWTFGRLDVPQVVQDGVIQGVAALKASRIAQINDVLMPLGFQTDGKIVTATDSCAPL